MDTVPMELTIWEGDYGLPAMCPDCIYMMFYTKIAKVPIVYKYHNNPYWNIGETFPIFKHGRIYTSSIQLMIGYFRIKRYGTEFGLSSKQCSQSYAFSNMLENSLRPIVEYIWWIDSKNYNKFTKPWFVKAMPVPLNLVYPIYRRQRARALIESLFEECENQDLLHSYMFNSAEKCFTTLKVRLGNGKYFYGNTPTSLDAMVYAYLSPLVKIPFPSCDIPRLLQTYNELKEFINRIDAEYYPDLKYGSRFGICCEKDSDEAVPLSSRAMLFTCIVVLSAIILYVSTHRISIPNITVPTYFIRA